MPRIVDIGPECFTDLDAKVISYKGENYYLACDKVVTNRPEGGQSFCVKRVGHPSREHEDWDGNTRDKTLPVLTIAKESPFQGKHD